MIDEVDISRNINTQGCSRKGSQFYSQSFNVGDSRFHEEVEVGGKKTKDLTKVPSLKQLIPQVPCYPIVK